jgi:negative regulator of replication initiation
MVASVFVVATAACFTSACIRAASLTQLLEARRLASELHVEFTKASEAGNRAVMADTDETSAAAADEARRARELVKRDLQALQPVLESLGYRDDMRYLDGFKIRFDEYRRLDDEILPLAVENTNLKAQRLSFGPAREAANALRTSLDAAVRTGAKNTCRAEALAAKGHIAVLEVQVMQAPHIAEAEDAAMTRMEQQMAASEADGRKALEELRATLPLTASSQLSAAVAALDRFEAVNTEIVRLSRRNSNVRSLALSLGRKRIVTAECEDQLRALNEALASHRFNATR